MKMYDMYALVRTRHFTKKFTIDIFFTERHLT
jgi:hypothetical protein